METLTPGSRGRVVAIVGGGFSGTMVAVHLARLGGPHLGRVVLIEKGPRFARGVAYGTDCDLHLLNVPAGLMSALPDEPSHFLDWLARRDPSAHAGTFAPRRLYGAYLEELLAETLRTSPVRVDLVRDEVIDVDRSPGGRRLALTTRRGLRAEADRVVLSLGHPRPTPVDRDQTISAPGYVADPWAGDALDGLASDDSVALIGSGLTASDLIVEARARGHRGRIFAVSRHGLRPHRHQSAAPRPHFAIPDRPPTARALLRTIREEAEGCRAEGGDWRSVVDSVRPVAQALWRALDAGERGRFVRHLAARWDVHRHRVAPQVADALDAAERDGHLRFLAARVVAIAPRGDGVTLTLRPRGSRGPESLVVRRAINCTGPGRDIRSRPSPLLKCLMDRGLARPGPLGIGLEAGDHGGLADARGLVSDRLFAIGPLLKEGLWESTAVRELRCQASDLAAHLAGPATPRA